MMSMTEDVQRLDLGTRRLCRMIFAMNSYGSASRSTVERGPGPMKPFEPQCRG